MANKVRTPKTGGFSLVETAIVLAVIGGILGAVFMIATQAWEHVRRELAVEAIATTVANVRSYYGGQPGLPSKTSAALTDQLLNSNVIPASLNRGTTCAGNACADNPWGSFNNGVRDSAGTFRVCNWSLGASSCPVTPAANSPFFGVVLSGLTQKSCIALVEAISGSGGPVGLVEVNISGTNLLASVKTIQPVSPSDAMTFCPLDNSGEGIGIITFIYRVAAPTL